MQWGEGTEEMGMADEPLPVWLDAHTGPVSALDIHASTHQVWLVLPALAAHLGLHDYNS